MLFWFLETKITSNYLVFVITIRHSIISPVNVSLVLQQNLYEVHRHALVHTGTELACSPDCRHRAVWRPSTVNVLVPAAESGEIAKALKSIRNLLEIYSNI